MARRRRKAQKQPIAQINIITTVIGVLSLIVFGVMISEASRTGSQLPRVISGLGLLLCIASICSGIQGYRTLGDVEHNTLFRITGFVLPLLAAVLWLVVYVYGIFVF